MTFCCCYFLPFFSQWTVIFSGVVIEVFSGSTLGEMASWVLVKVVWVVICTSLGEMVSGVVISAFSGEISAFLEEMDDGVAVALSTA